MAKQHKELRKALIQKEMDMQDLYKFLGKSASYLSGRVAGRKPFTMEDVYKICKVLDIPITEIHTYFPPQKGW